jgi:hypothetical protein
MASSDRSGRARGATGGEGIDAAGAGASTLPTIACPPACTLTCSTVIFCWPFAPMLVERLHLFDIDADQLGRVFEF